MNQDYPALAQNDIVDNDRILVIDDNLDIHRDFRNILERTNSDLPFPALDIFSEPPDAPTRVKVRGFRIDSAYQGEEGYDLVIGSRALGDMQKGAMMPQQIFGNWLATNLIKLFYGYQFTDLGPFRAIRFDKLLELDMQDKDFGWTVEMQVKAAKNKYKCTEVPVRYRKRVGLSKVSGTARGAILAGHKILWTIFKLL